MKTADQIVSEIDDILKDIWNSLNDPETLSISILKLAVLNGGLGNHLAELQDGVRKMESHYKYAIERDKVKYVDKGLGVGLAESHAKIDNQELARELNKVFHSANILKLKRQDTDTAIDTARSRLSLIKADIRQS